MANKITELKSAIGAGARVNKYRLNFMIPPVVGTSSKLGDVDTLCKATTFPAITIGAIEVFNQGRKLMLPGDTTYGNTWTITFYGTEDHGLRKDLIAWAKAADHFQNNQHSGDPAKIMTDLSVEQLDSAGNPTVKYTFHHTWCSEVAEVSLADDTDGGIIEFDATFTFTDWVVGDGETNDTSAGNAPTLNPVAE